MDVGLLDVVPWTHGYAHSWALRWMLANNDQARDALFALFVPDGRAPWHIERPIELEHRVGRHRADLRVVATDISGRAATVIVETKVNDGVSDSQLRAYCSETVDVVVPGPGLTGLLHGGNESVACERWMTGREVVDALSDVDLPDLIRSYVGEVAAQADRMDGARAAARGERADFARAKGISGVTGENVEAVAWVSEVAASMRAGGADDVRVRDTAHDYGVFWAGSWQSMAAFNDAGVYVDVIAAHGGGEYVITVKVGDGEVDDRIAVYDAAISAPPPWDGWLKGRRSRSANFRLWKLCACEMTAGEAADAALRVNDYLLALAAS